MCTSDPLGSSDVLRVIGRRSPTAASLRSRRTLSDCGRYDQAVYVVPERPVLEPLERVEVVDSLVRDFARARRPGRRAAARPGRETARGSRASM